MQFETSIFQKWKKYKNLLRYHKQCTWLEAKIWETVQATSRIKSNEINFTLQRTFLQNCWTFVCRYLSKKKDLYVILLCIGKVCFILFLSALFVPRVPFTDPGVFTLQYLTGCRESNPTELLQLQPVVLLMSYLHTSHRWENWLSWCDIPPAQMSECLYERYDGEVADLCQGHQEQDLLHQHQAHQQQDYQVYQD